MITKRNRKSNEKESNYKSTRQQNEKKEQIYTHIVYFCTEK
jgi:hypothetical protein